MEQPGTARKFLKFLVNAVLIVVSPALFILSAELFLRLIHYKPPEIVTREKYKDVNKLYLPHSHALWCGNLGHALDFENEVVTNALTLHDTDHAFEKNPGVYRILFLGDSFVESLQVPLEDTFFKIIERDLNKKSKELFGKESIEAVAIGRSGAGSIQETVDLVNLGLKFSPNLVITLVVDQNDFKDDVLFLDRLKNPGKYRRSVNIFRDIDAGNELELYERMMVFNNSLLNRWLAFKIFEIRQKPKIEAEQISAYGDDMAIFEKDGAGIFGGSKKVWDNVFKITASNHIRMARLSRGKNADYLVVFVPNTFIVEPGASRDLYRFFPRYKGKLDFKRPVHWMERAFDAYQVNHLDLNGAFADFFLKNHRALHFRHDGHWNKEGHQFAAVLIENYLEKKLNQGKLTP